MQTKKKVLGILSAVALAASGVCIAMSTGVYNFAISPYIHDYFNTSPTTVVAVDGADASSTQYYTADYSDTTALMEAKFQYIEDSVSEGTVLLKNDNSTLPVAAKDSSNNKTKVTLLGQASYNFAYSMDAGAGQIASADKYCKHLDQAFKDAGYDVN